MGSLISGIDYFKRGARTVKTLGLAAMTVKEIGLYLKTGRLPGRAVC